MKMLYSAAITVAATGCLLLASCQKDETKDPKPSDAEMKSAMEWTMADQVFGEMKSIADQGESDNLSTYKNGSGFASCATVTFNQANKEFIIDFGATNCLCKDGRNRRGKLKVNYSTAYWDSAGTVTITTIGYHVNDFKVEGTKTILNNGTNVSGQPNWDIDVEGKITYPGGLDTIYWESDRKHTWVKGYNSLFNWTDDTWEISGQGELITSGGETWNVNITSPLVKEVSCKFVSKGTIEISSSGRPSRIIDYGQGICDNDATLTISGKTYPFKLN